MRPVLRAQAYIMSVIEMSVNDFFRVCQGSVQSPLDYVDVVLNSLVVDKFILLQSDAMSCVVFVNMLTYLFMHRHWHFRGTDVCRS